jgi:uncharacterized protein YdhG (YjbR/CyaY superfamily)
MKNSIEKSQIKTINDYLSDLPEATILALENVRELIRTLAPHAEECISYKIPTFKYHGTLVAFAAFKNHCSFFTCDGSTVEQFKSDLKGFSLAKSGIHFTPEKPIPDALLTRIILKRMQDNEVKFLAKKKK